MHGKCCLIEFGWPLSSSLPSTSLDIVVAASRLSALEPLCGCITWQTGLIWDPYSNLASYSMSLNARNKVFHRFFPTNTLWVETKHLLKGRSHPISSTDMVYQPWSTRRWCSSWRPRAVTWELVAFKRPAHSWGTKISSAPASTMAWAHRNHNLVNLENIFPLGMRQRRSSEVAKCTFCDMFTTSHQQLHHEE